MKLSTFLLPTGHFALIVSTAGPYPSQHVVDGVAAFSKAIGARAFLFTDQSIQTEDALVDESAIEYSELDDEPEVDGWDESHVFLPNTDQGYSVDFSVGHVNPRLLQTLFGGAPGDELVREHVEAGHEFSPAGLVKLTDEEKAEKAAALVGETPSEYAEALRREQLAWAKRDELFDDVPLNPQAPYLADQVEQLPGPIGEELVDIDTGVTTYAPQIGETVVVAVEGSEYGSTTWCGEPVLGQEMVVYKVANPHPVIDKAVVYLNSTGVEEQAGLIFAADDVLPLSAV